MSINMHIWICIYISEFNLWSDHVCSTAQKFGATTFNIFIYAPPISKCNVKSAAMSLKLDVSH